MAEAGDVGLDGRSDADLRAAHVVDQWAVSVPVLATATSTEYRPGTNRKGDVSGGNWTFLLPALSLERVVCLDAPSPKLLPTLRRIARELIVVDGAKRDAGTVHERASDETAVVLTETLAPVEAGSVDLIVVPRRRARQFLRDLTLRADVARILAPSGLLYVEPVTRRDGAHAVESALRQDFGALEPVWVTPPNGEVHAAAPACDPKAIGYLTAHKLDRAPVAGSRATRRIKKLVRRVPGNRHRRPSGFLFIARLDTGRPPAYLRELATRAGSPIDDQRWALAAPGAYSSKKVVFFLFDDQEVAPRQVVKLTRDPIHNSRLENEYRALVALSATGFGRATMLPRPTFFGYHGGLAALGETAVDGVPFQERTTATPDCPTALATIEWLIDLASATADRTVAPPSRVANTVQKLLQTCAEIYELDATHRAFLEGQVNVIGASGQPFPVVFQHGDPGAWNVTVGADGGVTFLDWEAAEPRGIPLWDLFYFLRSYMVLASRTHTRRGGPLQAVTDAGLQATPMSRLLASAAANLCARVGLDPSLVEPLFHLCWAHRALKEATRLAPRQLQRGHYINLLRRCIDRRDSPGLQLLFHSQPDASAKSEPIHQVEGR